MHPSRLFGLAAVLFKGVCAGTIDSSSGNATVTPAPRRNVRRERCLFVMNMGLISSQENEREARSRGFHALRGWRASNAFPCAPSAYSVKSAAPGFLFIFLLLRLHLK